jgi:peptide-methionine (S)-S-oxide reductase
MLVMERFFAGLLSLLGLLPASSATAAAQTHFPAPLVDQASSAHGKQTAVLAGGCFWGLEAVFSSLRGVSSVESGFSGGSGATAHYEVVSTGLTGHAESVKITYDPAQISYGTLLMVYFNVATDPTQLNRQGPDSGTQYRSAIFYATPDQRRVAEAYVKQLTAAKAFDAPIVTQIVPLRGFYAAEDYHQHYLVEHPSEPYIVFNDIPKLQRLEKVYPSLVKPNAPTMAVIGLRTSP